MTAQSLPADSAAITLGVATVGLGVGEQHATTYARLPHCRLLWLFDLDASKAREVAMRLADTPVAPSYETILADRLVDIVSIASYDDAHSKEIVAALSAGKHVFVEKPLCRSLSELRAIRDAWRGSDGCHMASNLVLRAAPLFGWLRQAIGSGALGEVYAFDGDYLYGRLDKITHGWRRDVEDYSVMQGGGLHLVDLMLWLTGERPVSVNAAGNRISTRDTAFRYDDFVAATFTFPSGLIGRITANFGCVHRHQHVVRVFGTKATFVYDDAGARLHESRDPATPSEALTNLSSVPSTKGDLIPAFVDDVLAASDSSTAAQSEFDVISVCLAVDASLEVAGAAPVEYVCL